MITRSSKFPGFSKINFTNSIGWNQIRCTKINNTTYQSIDAKNHFMLVLKTECISWSWNFFKNNSQRSQMLNRCSFLYFSLRFLHREGDTQLFFRQLVKSYIYKFIKKIGWKVTTLSSQSCRPSLVPLTIATKLDWSEAVNLVFKTI